MSWHGIVAWSLIVGVLWLLAIRDRLHLPAAQVPAPTAAREPLVVEREYVLVTAHDVELPLGLPGWPVDDLIDLLSDIDLLPEAAV